MLDSMESVIASAREAVAETVVSDIHTHLFPPSHGRLLLWGADELLTYHYLVAELFTVAGEGLTHEKFWRLSKSAQADLIWEALFVRHGPLSEACRGVLTTFTRLGLDVGRRDLAGIRKWFAAQKVDKYLEKVLDLANIDYAVMTNNPFNSTERQFLDAGLPCPDRLRTALRIDPLLSAWDEAVSAMTAAGYDVRVEADGRTLDEVRRYLSDWSRRLRPVYFAASLPPDFAYPDDSLRTRLIDRAVLPAAMQAGVPFAMMIGVRKLVQPGLGDGGDAVGVADVSAVMRLCQGNPKARFLATMLSRVNQHELTVLARKFANLHLFGCWWFLNNPSIIEEMTRQRLELLGTAFTCQHSDARVLDQLIYKWDHSRRVVAGVLADKYRDLWLAGWRPTEQEIARDVRALFGGSFEAFLKRPS